MAQPRAPIRCPSRLNTSMSAEQSSPILRPRARSPSAILGRHRRDAQNFVRLVGWRDSLFQAVEGPARLRRGGSRADPASGDLSATRSSAGDLASHVQEIPRDGGDRVGRFRRKDAARKVASKPRRWRSWGCSGPAASIVPATKSKGSLGPACGQERSHPSGCEFRKSKQLLIKNGIAYGQ